MWLQQRVRKFTYGYRKLMAAMGLLSIADFPLLFAPLLYTLHRRADGVPEEYYAWEANSG
jgi:hypothetical protein